MKKNKEELKRLNEELNKRIKEFDKEGRIMRKRKRVFYENIKTNAVQEKKDKMKKLDSLVRIEAKLNEAISNGNIITANYLKKEREDLEGSINFSSEFINFADECKEIFS